MKQTRFQRIKTTSKRNDVEGPIQTAIVEFLEWQFPLALTHHCRNEINFSGKKFQVELAKAKRRGAKKGFPDLIVLFPDGTVVFFEVKAPGNYATPEQKAMHEVLRSMGHFVAVVRSIDDVKAELRGWGLLK